MTLAELDALRFLSLVSPARISPGYLTRCCREYLARQDMGAPGVRAELYRFTRAELRVRAARAVDRSSSQ